MVLLYAHFHLWSGVRIHPKTYWGYYQDYIAQISWKKIQKKLSRFSAKLHDPGHARQKLTKMGVSGNVQILS